MGSYFMGYVSVTGVLLFDAMEVDGVTQDVGFINHSQAFLVPVAYLLPTVK